MRYIYLKETIGLKRQFEAYTALTTLLRTEGLQEDYMAIRKELIAAGQSAQGTVIIYKVPMTTYNRPSINH